MTKRREAVAIQLEGRQFNSVKEACNFLHVKDTSALNKCIRKGKKKYKGFNFKVIKLDSNQLTLPLNNNKKEEKILPLEMMRQELQKKFQQQMPQQIQVQKPKHSKKKKRINGKECPVFCENLQKSFGTIKEAAKFAQVNNWTMSQKMASAGRFVDSQGNSYIRMKPMQSGRVYKNTGETLCKTFNRKPKNNMVDIKTVSQEVQPTPIMIKQIEKPVINKKDITTNMLKEKIIECVNKDNFEQAKQIMNVINML